MKLYATIQAEKLQDGKTIIVKKSQGSNTLLDINITNEHGHLLAYVQVLHRENALPMVYYARVPQHAYSTTSLAERDAIVSMEKDKGKKQKDE